MFALASSYKLSGPTPGERAVLETIQSLYTRPRRLEPLTLSEIAKASNISHTHAGRRCAALCAHGLLVRRGEGVCARYVLPGTASDVRAWEAVERFLSRYPASPLAIEFNSIYGGALCVS